jgi:outer membrane biosynthesis protein TonB
MKELVLMKSSGISSLDLAARSALMRAKFPPLPPGFEARRLGVTYRFHDESQ